MIKRKASPEETAKKAYQDAVNANALAKVTKTRLNLVGFHLGFAYGKEKSVNKNSHARRFLIAATPISMIGRETSSKESHKVRKSNIIDGICFDSRSKDCPSVTRHYGAGFSNVIGVSDGPWHENLPLGVPVLIYDVNASTSKRVVNGETKTATFNNASGLERINDFRGISLGGYMPFSDILHAFHDAGAIMRRVPAFTSDLAGGEDYPDPAPSLIVPLGEYAFNELEKFSGQKWPLNLSVLSVKFSYEDQDKITWPKLSMTLWGAQTVEDDKKEHFVVNLNIWKDELETFGILPKRKFDRKLMVESLVPFIAQTSMILLCNINFKKTREMPENMENGLVAGSAVGNAFDEEAPKTEEQMQIESNMPHFGWDVTGTPIAAFPEMCHEFGVPVSASFAKEFTESNELKTATSDTSFDGDINRAAKDTLHTHGVVVMNTRSRSALEVLEKRSSEAKFFVFIPQMLTIHGADGARGLARRAQAISVDDSTALVNYMLSGQDDILTDASRAIVNDKLVTNLTGENEPKPESMVLVAVLTPKKTPPVYEMYRENVFSLPSLDGTPVQPVDETQTAEGHVDKHQKTDDA